MKRRFEYQPGLFGLASVAAGCAVKDGKVRTQGNSISAGGQRENESRSRSEKARSSTLSSRSRVGRDNEAVDRASED
jgi:hypothetical protein